MIHIAPGSTGQLSPAILYRNVLAQGTLSVSSETADGAGANALGPQTYDYWIPSTVPATLAVTLGAPVECDCIAVVGHTLGSAGATLHCDRYDADTSTWVPVISIAPADDSDILGIFPAAASAGWRTRVTGAVAAISIAMIGARLLVPEGVQAPYMPLDQARRVELTPSITVTGQYLGTFVRRTGGATAIKLAPQQRSWIEGDAAPFITHFNAGRPFVFAAAPGLLARDVGYCWRDGPEMAATYLGGAVLGELSMSVAAYG